MEPCESCGKLTTTGCPLCEKKGKKWKCCKKCEKGEKYAKHIKKHQTSAKTPTIEVKRFGEEMEGDAKRVKQDGRYEINTYMKPKDKKNGLGQYMARIANGVYPVIKSVQDWYLGSEAVRNLKQDMRESLYYAPVHWLTVWQNNPKAVVYFLLSQVIETFEMKMSNSDGERIRFVQDSDWKQLEEDEADQAPTAKKANTANELANTNYKLYIQMDTPAARRRQTDYSGGMRKYRFLLAAWRVIRFDAQQPEQNQILSNNEGEFGRYLAYSACARKGLDEEAVIHYWPSSVHNANLGTELYSILKNNASCVEVEKMSAPSVLRFQYDRFHMTFIRTDVSLPERKSSLAAMFN